MTHKVRIQQIEREIRGVAGQFGVTSWEHSFLADIARCENLSDKQAGVLNKIEAKVFGEQKRAA